jgi:hypothetical protein
MGFLSSIFGADKLVESISKVATEIIDTPEEKAAANALILKTLDPNGSTRLQITKVVTLLYVVYVAVMMLLMLAQAFEIGNPSQVLLAVNNMKDLFTETTTAFSLIVGASFGVNGMNSYKGR